MGWGREGGILSTMVKRNVSAGPFTIIKEQLTDFNQLENGVLMICNSDIQLKGLGLTPANWRVVELSG